MLVEKLVANSLITLCCLVCSGRFAEIVRLVLQHFLCKTQSDAKVRGQ